MNYININIYIDILVYLYTNDILFLKNRLNYSKYCLKTKMVKVNSSFASIPECLIRNIMTSSLSLIWWENIFDRKHFDKKKKSILQHVVFMLLCSS